MIKSANSLPSLPRGYDAEQLPECRATASPHPEKVNNLTHVDRTVETMLRLWTWALPCKCPAQHLKWARHSAVMPPPPVKSNTPKGTHCMRRPMMTESPPAHQNCEGQEAAAAEKYRADIATVLREVAAGPRFRESAALRAERLKAAGGVPRAATASAHTVHGS